MQKQSWHGDGPRARTRCLRRFSRDGDAPQTIALDADAVLELAHLCRRLADVLERVSDLAPWDDERERLHEWRPR